MNARLPETDDGTPVVEIRIPARAEWVAVARLAVAAVGSRFDLSVEDIEDLKLAVAEACTICIRRTRDRDQVELVCRAAPDRLHITVRNATGGNHLTVADPDDTLALVIVESLMEDVSLRTDGGSTIVEMSKRTAAEDA